MRRTSVVGVMLLAAAVGCQPSQPGYEQPVTMRGARSEVSRLDQDRAYEKLAEKAQPGQSIGDLVTLEGLEGYTIMADSIVVGLEGRGTKRIPPKMRPDLVKLLVKAFDTVGVAEQMIDSKDAAPVRVTAVIPPFAQRDEKIDVRLEAQDTTVNLEGGMLVETPLIRWVPMEGGTHRDFRTPSGLVSAGVQAYARGDVTLSQGYRGGTSVGPELPHVGYLPAGAKVERTWAFRLILKKPDANTSLLVEAAIKQRFAGVETVTSPAFIGLTMPNKYVEYWKRYLDVVQRIRVRPPTLAVRLKHAGDLAQVLGSSNSKVRYDAECTLEAYGREAAEVLLKMTSGGNATTRQSALRVLAFVDDKRTIDPLITESRSAEAGFRAESTYLMACLGGEAVEQRLTEMLSDEDGITRYRALIALDRVKAKDAPVQIYYSQTQRNFAMHLVDVPGKKMVVVKPLEGIRRIVLFGRGIEVTPGFSGGVGPISLTVDAESTAFVHKRSPGGRPEVLRTRELANVVSALDSQFGVSINDIMGLIGLMGKKGSLGAELYWAD